MHKNYKGIPASEAAAEAFVSQKKKKRMVDRSSNGCILGWMIVTSQNLIVVAMSK